MQIRKIASTLLLVVVGYLSTTAAHAQTGPVTWTDNGNTYQLVFANLTWTSAEAAAEATLRDGQPGHLVTIGSAAENSFVANLSSGDFRAWIGLSDTANEGSFAWVTGEPVTYTNWSGGEPNNSVGGEDYVEMFASNDAWNDRVNTPFTASNAAYIIEWEAPPPAATVFSIVIIPDTQMYVEQHPEVFEAQIDWIVANEGAENIIYVAHLGDLKDDLSCDTKTVNVGTGNGRSEWQIVDQALGDLDAAAIAYGVVPGNHDFDQVSGGCPNFTTQRPLGTYDSLMGPGRFAGTPHYGDPSVPTPGNRVVNSNEDSFTLFESNGVKFIAINLAYRQGANAVGVDPEVVWANNLLSTYSDRLGIITSHYFMDANPGNNLGPYGQEVYDGLSGNPNMFMMLSAHEFGEAWLIETTGRGGMQPVQVLLSDYQRDVFPSVDGDINTPPNNPNPAGIDFANISQTSFGDSGFMRIMRFDTATGQVNIETFIPPVIPIKNRPGTLISTYFPATGNGMDEGTASNLSFTYLGYVN
jgi:hypothetical protein